MVAKDRDLSRLNVSHEQNNTDEVPMLLIKGHKIYLIGIKGRF